MIGEHVTGIGYAEIEGLIAMMSGVPDRALIRRRFKYLQRMSFPPNSNTGRGRRTVLDVEQTLQVVLAIELMQVGASPTRSIRVLRTNWEQLLPALVVGWLVSRKPALAPLRELLVMNAAAFSDAGGSEDPHEPVSEPLRPQPAIDLIAGLARQGSTTRVMIDPAKLAMHLIDYAGRPDSGLTPDALDASFASLWQRVMEGSPDDWVARAIAEDRLTDIERSVEESLGLVPPSQGRA